MSSGDRHIRKFGCLCSVRERSSRTDAINRWRVNDLDTKHDLILAGGHGSRRTLLVTVEQDEHAQSEAFLSSGSRPSGFRDKSKGSSASRLTCSLSPSEERMA